MEVELNSPSEQVRLGLHSHGCTWINPKYLDVLPYYFLQQTEKKNPQNLPIARGKNNSTAFFFQIDSRTLLFSGNTVDV
jgi:hypothetical protein